MQRAAPSSALLSLHVPFSSLVLRSVPQVVKERTEAEGGEA